MVKSNKDMAGEWKGAQRKNVIQTEKSGLLHPR